MYLITGNKIEYKNHLIQNFTSFCGLVWSPSPAVSCTDPNEWTAGSYSSSSAHRYAFRPLQTHSASAFPKSWLFYCECFHWYWPHYYSQPTNAPFSVFRSEPIVMKLSKYWILKLLVDFIYKILQLRQSTAFDFLTCQIELETLRTELGLTVLEEFTNTRRIIEQFLETKRPAFDSQLSWMLYQRCTISPHCCVVHYPWIGGLWIAHYAIIVIVELTVRAKPDSTVNKWKIR